jgi:hypothetical protein
MNPDDWYQPTLPSITTSYIDFVHKYEIKSCDEVLIIYKTMIGDGIDEETIAEIIKL